MPPVPTAHERLRELDALRGLAAIAVVLFHYTTRYDALYGYPVELPFSLPWGDHGVDLFFMISGFVILMTLDRQSTAAGFAFGRFSRLFPVFWVAVALTFSVLALAPWDGYEVSTRDALLNLTMTPALLKAQMVDGVYWSLQIELFFYAAMLALHCAGWLKNLNRTLWIWLALATLVQGSLSLGASQTPAGPILTKLLTLLSLDYIHLFAIGMTLYRAHQRGRLCWPDLLLISACLVWRGMFDNSWLPVVIIAALVVLLWQASRGLSWLRHGTLIYLGAISYSLYLVHQNIGYLVIENLLAYRCHPYLCILAATGLSLFLATLLTFFIERPAARWLKAMLSLRQSVLERAVKRRQARVIGNILGLPRK